MRAKNVAASEVGHLGWDRLPLKPKHSGEPGGRDIVAGANMPEDEYSGVLFQIEREQNARRYIQIVQAVDFIELAYIVREPITQILRSALQVASDVFLAAGVHMLIQS